MWFGILHDWGDSTWNIRDGKDISTESLKAVFSLEQEENIWKVNTYLLLLKNQWSDKYVSILIKYIHELERWNIDVSWYKKELDTIRKNHYLTLVEYNLNILEQGGWNTRSLMQVKMALCFLKNFEVDTVPYEERLEKCK